MEARTDMQNDTFQSDAKRVNASSRRINAIAGKVGAARYLEIGINEGKTFFRVNIAGKTGVDPQFKFDIATRPENEHFYQMTSDEWFLKHSDTEPFDVIFLDGLHTFTQTFRDFCNSIFVAHKRTVWLLDDTVPSDAYAAWHNHKEAARARKLDLGQRAGPRACGWNGDVYKLVFAIHDFFPKLSYRTISTGGRCQTVVWHQTRSEYAPLFDDLGKIAALSYFDFRNNQAILKLATEQEVLNDIVLVSE